MSIQNYLSKNYRNFRGWSTRRKIVVIESDDWGTVRVSSKKAYLNLLEKKISVDSCPYNSLDALESNDDLERLFEILNSVKDANSDPAVITANNIVANPDFEKIKDSNYREYHFEVFTETLKKYPCHGRVESLYREGISSRLFKPQFHGREHVHISHWLSALQNKNELEMLAFQNNMFTVYKGKNSNCRSEYLDAFATYTPEQLQNTRKSILEGLNIFEKLWGYRSKSAIAPCYIWHPKVEGFLAEGEIVHIQSGIAQKIPNFEVPNYSIQRKVMGERNLLNQVFTIRNATFEPSLKRDKDWVNFCLADIKNAFFWKKPAIISSHRLNYIGFIDEMNSSKNLILLHQLLKRVVCKWPDVEFMSSDQLGNLIRNS